MSKMAMFLILGVLFISSFAYSQNDIKMTTKADTIAYSIGFLTGSNLLMNIQRDSLGFNLKLILKGLEQGMMSLQPACTQQQMQAYMMDFQKEFSAKKEAQKNKEMAEAKVKGEENRKLGEAFLADNKTKPGVKTTASGLQYKVVKDSSAGKHPLATDQVKVHYKGTLINGKVFDSSIDRGEPITFPLNGVIKGWTEGLQLMREGSKYIFYIPSDLAYGEKGAGGGNIGPNETLIFEVELLQVIKSDDNQQGVKPIDPNNKK